jgi:hypothetical protein
MKNNIKSLIKNYAKVYQEFELIQDGKIMPKGDQKTGVIAEYYAKCYIESKCQTEVAFAKSGEPYDLSYETKDGLLIKVQVKCVSAHSLTRIIAPLNLKKQTYGNPFDELYLISLDKNFMLEALYINTYDEIINKLKKEGDKRDRIVGSVMRGKSIKHPTKKGSWMYDFNKIELNK